MYFGRFFLVSIAAVAVVVNGQPGQTAAPSACPTTTCCEDDCCGVGTRWVAPLCVNETGAPGYDGSYVNGYTEGCAYRECCEKDCCGPGTSYNDVTGFCNPTINGTVTEDGTISGTVKCDTNNDGVGDMMIPNVPITLFDGSGIALSTTLTGGNGNYVFNIPVGTYTVVQTNSAPCFLDVSDVDGGDPNTITVTIGGGAPMDSTGNDYCDEPTRTVSGTVLEDTDNDNAGDTGLSGVTITIFDVSGVADTTAVTDSNGYYEVPSCPPGYYTVVQTLPGGYTAVGDSDGGDPNTIAVDINSGDSTSNIAVVVAT